MSCLSRAADSLLRLLVRAGTSGQRLRRIYREQIEAANQAAAEVLAAATEEADQLRATVRAKVQAQVGAELTKARKDARASVEKSMERACQTAVQQARSEALLLAYNEAATSLGLATMSDATALESRRRDNAIDATAAYPNIYDTGEAWVVRVLEGEIRHVQVFTYTNRNEKAQRLVDAVRCRNMIASAEQSHHSAIYEECLLHARQSYGEGPHLHVRAAEQFHIRMTQAGDRVDHFRFVGTDPEDRFQIADHTILTEPLGTLVNDNRRVLDAFARLGLDHRRTVRDLLLLTGDELLEATGFGAASLRRLRAGLAEYGLALWADEAPAAPPPPREPGDRNFRSIEFE